MKKKMIEFELEDGGTVFVEVEDTEEASGRQRVSRGGETGETEKAEKRFTEAISAIKPAADAVLKTFRDMNTPDEIGLEFGVKMTGKAGAIFTSVTGEATFKVSLKWKNKNESK